MKVLRYDHYGAPKDVLTMANEATLVPGPPEGRGPYRNFLQEGAYCLEGDIGSDEG